MKRILITGANSYIGGAFESYMKQNYADVASIDTIDMKDLSWKNADFSRYDVVFHVAGIAHADVSNVSDEIKKQYYKINTDLAIETAEKAKREGVHQFIFMSSMIIYGTAGHISQETLPNPENFYGDSKWQADQAIQNLTDGKFRTVVLRPPMIYGKNSKGNYPVLARLAQRLPVFPNVMNQRSMLYIENLCEFLHIIIDEDRTGVFFPQNEELVNTSQMVKLIAQEKKHKIYLWNILNIFVTAGKHFPGKIGKMCNKAFGDSYYDLSISDIGRKYCVADLEESIRRTEGKLP